MSNLLSTNSKDDLNENKTNTIPLSTLFCICCLEKEVPYISLLTCSHADFLNSLTVPEMKPKNKVVCHQCHNMLKKIKLFKLQVEDSFNLLTNQVFSPKISNQRQCNIKVHKILDINIPQTNCIENQQTIQNTDINKTIKKENETFDEKQNTTEMNIPPSLTNKDKKLKNIEEALRIINNNQNNGCVNLLATSLQSLSNTILTDHLKILNDFQLLNKTFTHPASTNKNNAAISTDITTNIKEDNKMLMNETNDVIVNEVDIVKEELDLPVTFKDEGVDDTKMQTDELTIDEPQPSINSNIKEVRLTKEELMQERSNTAASPSFLRSAHRCESCLIGFHYEENLQDHVKRKHNQKEGSINCDVCLQSISPGVSYDEHVCRHYTSGDEDMNLTPAHLETVHNTELSFLPNKSREKYLKAYELFATWRHNKGEKTFSETIMLSYFNELSKTRKSSTLWSIYSMLKATIKTKKDIHIEKYSKLLAFLKEASSGYKSKKSRIFTTANIEQFLNEAPDSEFLATKVVLIIGINGACRTNELTYLTTKNIEKHSDKLLLVKLPNTKTNIERNFVIRNEYVKFIEKYQALRPDNTLIDRFFLQYRNGKCVRQPMGSTKIGRMPQKIASFLKLKEPELYTGHCFRRTSATLLADSGADLTNIKRHGGSKSNTVADGYTEDSIESDDD